MVSTAAASRTAARPTGTVIDGDVGGTVLVPAEADDVRAGTSPRRRPHPAAAVAIREKFMTPSDRPNLCAASSAGCPHVRVRGLSRRRQVEPARARSSLDLPLRNDDHHRLS